MKKHELVLTWADGRGEEFALDLHLEQGGLVLDAQQRRRGKVVRMEVPEEGVKDLADFLQQVARYLAARRNAL